MTMIGRQFGRLRVTGYAGGCITKERAYKWTQDKISHGMSGTPTHSSWKSMRNRCNNPTNGSYRYYGERGIKVCDRWSSFKNFYSDMGERPPGTTIDRIDSDGDYEPSNCKWSTNQEQYETRRNHNQHTKEKVV
jgi:hypothetical protein